MRSIEQAARFATLDDHASLARSQLRPPCKDSIIAAAPYLVTFVPKLRTSSAVVDEPVAHLGHADAGSLNGDR